MSPDEEGVTLVLTSSLLSPHSAPRLLQDQFSHGSGGAPPGVGAGSQCVRCAEPERRRFSGLQQTEESSGASGKGVDAAV